MGGDEEKAICPNPTTKLPARSVASCIVDPTIRRISTRRAGWSLVWVELSHCTLLYIWQSLMLISTPSDVGVTVSIYASHA